MSATKCRNDECGLFYDDQHTVCPFCGSESGKVDPALEALNQHLYSMAAGAQTERSTEARVRNGGLD